MAIPVARVHLAMANAALPALLPTPPKWKMLPLLSTPPYPCVAAAILQKPLAKPKPSRADADERWDARKTKPTCTEPEASSTPPKPGRADSAERWDAHKKPASPASSSSSSSSGSGTSSFFSSSKWPISRRATSSAERWDVHKERHHPPQADQRLDDVGDSSSIGSGNDDDIDTEEEIILWMLRAMYAGPGFVVAALESRVLPMPTALFSVPVA